MRVAVQSGRKRPRFKIDTPGMIYDPQGTPVLECIVRDISATGADRKSTRLNSSHSQISYAVFCLTKKQHSLAGCSPSSGLPGSPHSYSNAPPPPTALT